MTTPVEIDTTSLLTILGILAATWALISPANRLRFRFCMNLLDWVIAGIVFFLIHYLVFAPILERLGFYYSLGPWKWGFNSSSAVYLLFLSAVIYFFWRTRFPILVRGRIRVFRELIENLHFTKRYDELVLLLEPQLPKLILLSRHKPLIAEWIDRLDPPRINMAAFLRGEVPRARATWLRYLSGSLQSLKSWILARDETSTQAGEILLNLVTSPELTTHLAVAHPLFCLKLIEADVAIRSDFIDNYMDALLEAPGSFLYVELKNNQNLNGGSRLHLPKNNRLLHFFFSDAAKAMKHGLDKAIGDAVYRRLDEDRKLAEKLNESLGSYYEVGRFRCPINSGITLFEIMVHEGIHQGLQDHMWLHYFMHFTEKILKQIPMPPIEDSYHEWPTPFHYLLYRMISVATDWTEQCAYIDDAEIPEATRNADGFDRQFISKEATKVLGSMLQSIIPSKKISPSFKSYLLEVVIRSHNKLQGNPELLDVASSLRTAVIRGTNLRTEKYYLDELRNVFSRIDHVKRFEAVQFEEALKESEAIFQ